MQYLLRNTYNNVKIYPTTVLNNKIIYQDNKKQENKIGQVPLEKKENLNNNPQKIIKKRKRKRKRERKGKRKATIKSE